MVMETCCALVTHKFSKSKVESHLSMPHMYRTFIQDIHRIEIQAAKIENNEPFAFVLIVNV